MSSQCRRSYHKAAVLIVACSEALQSRGKGRDAKRLIENIRGSFPRHRVFQAELQTAIARMAPKLE